MSKMTFYKIIFFFFKIKYNIVCFLVSKAFMLTEYLFLVLQNVFKF